jgi:hypothetical protein
MRSVRLACLNDAVGDGALDRVILSLRERRGEKKREAKLRAV